MGFFDKLNTVILRPAAASCACPGCGAAIPLADVNVANDLALCRVCEKPWSYQAAVSMAQVDLSQADAGPPKGIEATRDFQGLSIKVNRLPKILWFLTPFFLVHGGAFAFAGWKILSGQTHDAHGGGPSSPLFGMPFAAVGLIEMVVLFVMCFARWTVSVQGQEGSVFYGVGSLGWRRAFILKRDSAVFLAATNMRTNGRNMQGICVETPGVGKLVFASSLPDDVKAYIMAMLIRQARGK